MVQLGVFRTHVENLYIAVQTTPTQPFYKSKQDFSSERYWA
jgi:hypothetical protein